MPTRDTSDISHEQVTDHNIQRIPQRSAGLQLRGVGEAEAMLPVGKVSAGDREFGLAYAQMAERGDRAAADKAMLLLTRAEKAGASDSPLHTQMGFLAQVAGQRERALAEYTMALRENPYEPSALGNLAVLDASGGRVGEAVSLLTRLISADPAQTAAGLNLAFIHCELGEGEQAKAVLLRIQKLNPDDPQLRAFLTSGYYAGKRCDLKMK